jgi:hypothetical protein
MRAREHEARMAEVRSARVKVRSARMRDELIYAKRRRYAGAQPFFGTSPLVTIDSWEQK